MFIVFILLSEAHSKHGLISQWQDSTQQINQGTARLSHEKGEYLL